MIRRLAIVSAVLVSVGTGGLTAASPAAAQAGLETDIEPPWCGMPEADAASNLPDGTEPGDPPGSFPHIPYYAIRCTLDIDRGAEQRADEGGGDRPVRARPRPVPRHDQRARHASSSAATSTPGSRSARSR